jgi:murein DD-endopeptidase MepM/ murein hydrolase activator NlpD
VGGLAWSARTAADWVAAAVLTVVMVAELWLAGPWSMIGRAWRPVWAIVSLSLPAAALAGASFHAGEPTAWSLVLAAAGLAGLLRIRRVVRFARRPAGAAALHFPLRAGSYAVVQGGPPVVNAHAGNAAQSWALDLVKLRPSGRRARGLHAGALDRYASFGQQVLSPCDGVVVRADDGHPDLAPPRSQPHVPAGNHVVIRMADGLLVVLAHLKDASVGVRPGGRVRAGEIVGRIGNSGNTTEPHLHIHVERRDADAHRAGQGVPMVFGETGGRQLRRNDVVTV